MGQSLIYRPRTGPDSYRWRTGKQHTHTYLEWEGLFRAEPRVAINKLVFTSRLVTLVAVEEIRDKLTLAGHCLPSPTWRKIGPLL